MCALKILTKLRCNSPRKIANVTVSKAISRYTYEPFPLWLAYGLAIFFSLFGLVIGNLAFYLNKVEYDKSFSSILQATRNPKLDQLIEPSTWPVRPTNIGLSKTYIRLFVGSTMVGGFEPAESTDEIPRPIEER